MYYYSIVERHTDGRWWYHRKTFTTEQEARDYAADALRWRDSRQVIIKHSKPLPDETLWTVNFDDFYWPGSTMLTYKADIVEVVADITKPKQ